MALARTAMVWPLSTNEVVVMYPNAGDGSPLGSGFGSAFGARPSVPNDDASVPALQRPYSVQFATWLDAKSPNAGRKRQSNGCHCVFGMSPTFPALSNPPPTPILMAAGLTRVISLAPAGSVGSAHAASISKAAITGAAERRPSRAVMDEAIRCAGRR